MKKTTFVSLEHNKRLFKMNQHTLHHRFFIFNLVPGLSLPLSLSSNGLLLVWGFENSLSNQVAFTNNKVPVAKRAKTKTACCTKQANTSTAVFAVFAICLFECGSIFDGLLCSSAFTSRFKATSCGQWFLQCQLHTFVLEVFLARQTRQD